MSSLLHIGNRARKCYRHLCNPHSPSTTKTGVILLLVHLCLLHRSVVPSPWQSSSRAPSTPKEQTAKRARLRSLPFQSKPQITLHFSYYLLPIRTIAASSLDNTGLPASHSPRNLGSLFGLLLIYLSGSFKPFSFPLLFFSCQPFSLAKHVSSNRPFTAFLLLTTTVFTWMPSHGLGSSSLKHKHIAKSSVPFIQRAEESST